MCGAAGWASVFEDILAQDEATKDEEDTGTPWTCGCHVSISPELQAHAEAPVGLLAVEQAAGRLPHSTQYDGVLCATLAARSGVAPLLGIAQAEQGGVALFVGTFCGRVLGYEAVERESGDDGVRLEVALRSVTDLVGLGPVVALRAMDLFGDGVEEIVATTRNGCTVLQRNPTGVEAAMWASLAKLGANIEAIETAAAAATQDDDARQPAEDLSRDALTPRSREDATQQEEDEYE